MKKKIIFALLFIVSGFIILNWYISTRVLGARTEGLFKVGSCVRDDEFGAVYKIVGTLKGKTQMEVISSEKYPSQEQYKIGYVKNIESNENPQKLYVIVCP